jgi:hypothetical protein
VWLESPVHKEAWCSSVCLCSVLRQSALPVVTVRPSGGNYRYLFFFAASCFHFDIVHTLWDSYFVTASRKVLSAEVVARDGDVSVQTVPPVRCIWDQSECCVDVYW